MVTDAKEVKFYEPTLTNRKQKPQENHGIHLILLPSLTGVSYLLGRSL